MPAWAGFHFQFHPYLEFCATHILREISVCLLSETSLRLPRLGVKILKSQNCRKPSGIVSFAASNIPSISLASLTSCCHFHFSIPSQFSKLMVCDGNKLPWLQRRSFAMISSLKDSRNQSTMFSCVAWPLSLLAIMVIRSWSNAESVGCGSRLNIDHQRETGFVSWRRPLSIWSVQRLPLSQVAG